ncbi:MAG: DUF1330 domain-containing protein [Pseudomonadota bacterium]
MTHHVDPTPEDYALFKSLPRDTEIHMFNLARFKKWAEYPSDHPQARSGWSGRRAYQEYGRISEPVLQRVGGKIVWRGTFDASVIGDLGQDWDDAFIACYPNAHAFLDMASDPVFRAAFVHRGAGVLDYRLVRFTPRQAGHGFSGEVAPV